MVGCCGRVLEGLCADMMEGFCVEVLKFFWIGVGICERYGGKLTRDLWMGAGCLGERERGVQGKRGTGVVGKENEKAVLVTDGEGWAGGGKSEWEGEQNLSRKP